PGSWESISDPWHPNKLEAASRTGSKSSVFLRYTPFLACSKSVVQENPHGEETKLRQLELQQFEGFSATALPPDRPRTPGIWHGDQYDAVATDGTGATGNDRATESAVSGHDDAARSLQEVALAGVGSHVLSTPSSLR